MHLQWITADDKASLKNSPANSYRLKYRLLASLMWS